MFYLKTLCDITKILLESSNNLQVCLTDSCRKIVSREFFVKCMVLFIVVFSILYNVPHCLETVVLECWHTRFESRSLEVCPDPFRFLPR